LLLGGALFLCGFAGCAYIAWQWAASGFGPLQQVREVLFWSMWLFLGVQIIFSSFFLSMLGISRDTYIGDYDLFVGGREAADATRNRKAASK
jgi:hypothetical protein